MPLPSVAKKPLLADLERTPDGRHNLKLYIGSPKKQKLRLALSTDQKYSAVIGKQCTSCYSPHRYDSADSQMYEQQSAPGDRIITKYDAKNNLIEKFTAQGQFVTDSLEVTYTPFVADSISTSIKASFTEIMEMKPGYWSRQEDGLLGLAPHTQISQSSITLKQYNFMYVLGRNKKITQNVFALYLSDTGEDDVEKHGSHIELGGWDPKGIKEGNELTMIRTLDEKHWYINAADFTINGGQLFSYKTRPIILDPDYPWIMIPKDEFYFLRLQLMKIDKNLIACPTNWNYCNFG